MSDTLRGCGLRKIRLVPWLLASLLAAPAGAGEVTVSDRRLVTDGRRLLLDLRLRGIFSVRARNAIAAGLTTGLTHEIRLGVARRRAVERQVAFEIRHDVWEDQYLVIRRPSRPDTVRTRDFETVERFCAVLDSVDLAPLEALTVGETFELKFRTRLETISPEQARRTRKWLESGDGSEGEGAGIRVDLGDIIDFFFNIYRSQEQTDWIHLGQFSWKYSGNLILEEVP